MQHKHMGERKYSSTHSVHRTRSPSWMAASHPSTHTEEETDRVQQLIWTWWQKEKSLPMPGIKPQSSSL